MLNLLTSFLSIESANLILYARQSQNVLKVFCTPYTGFNLFDLSLK